MPSQVNDGVRRWRLDTLENNLVWLLSFGCTVHRHGDAISVFHPNLPEYHAWLFHSDPEDLCRRLTSLSNDARDSKSPSNVYVDQTCDTAAWHDGLTRLGFRHVATSVVYVGRLRPRRRETVLRFRRAELAESASWSAVYSAGFGRAGKQATLDLERWRLCFRSGEAVQSWFLVYHGETIGVVQTCRAHDVVGIYSLAVLPPWRRQFGFRRAIEAAQFALAFDAPVRSYFEKIRSPGRPNRNWVMLSGDRFDIVRTMNAYAQGQSA